MSASDELRNLAESWVMNGDIPSYVKHDLDTLAIEVSEIERERDERRIVTAQEHGRVVQVYIDMLAEKNYENARLRELVKAFDWCTENFDLPCKCDSCPLDQTVMLTPECEVRMHELGIEAE